MSKFNSIIETKYTQLLEQQTQQTQPTQPVQQTQQTQPTQPVQQTQQTQPQQPQQTQQNPIVSISQQLNKLIDYKNPANAIKTLNQLFPANNANNVNLFKQVGYDPQKGFVTVNQQTPAVKPLQ